MMFTIKNAKRSLALAEAKATDAAENHLKLSVASKKAAKMAETASKDVLHLEELSAAAKVTIALANANLASAKASAAAAEAVVAVSENKVLEAQVQATGEATAIKPNVKRPAKVKPVPLPIIVNPMDIPRLRQQAEDLEHLADIVLERFRTSP